MPKLIVEKDKMFADTVVRLDGKEFLRCTFTNCDIHYQGGFTRFVDCRREPCRYHFDGIAGRVAELMDTLGFLKDDLPFAQIKRSLSK